MTTRRPLGDKQFQHSSVPDGLVHSLGALHEESPISIAAASPK
jgi:hypothetical protein